MLWVQAIIHMVMKNDMSLMCSKQLITAKARSMQCDIKLFPLVSLTKYFDTSTSLITITPYKYL